MSNMNENIITIGQIGRVVTGKTPPTSNQEYFEGDYPFITPTDIGTFYEKYLNTTERTISNEGVKILKSCIIPANSVCFVSIGSTIGKMCYTNKQSFTNQQINSIVVNDNFDSEYIFYYLRYIRSYFMSIGSGTGSGKGIVNKSTFCNTKVKIEMNKDVQKSISNVLSTYDSLIENNNKRIKILEQMAEELYKEWFVRFRFPDNEYYDRKDVFKYYKIHELCSFSRGISYSSNEINCEEGLDLINLKNINAFGGFRRDGYKKYNGKYKDNHVVNTGDLVMGITDMTQDRRTVGSVALIPTTNNLSVISADLVKINSSINNQYLYCLFKYGEISKYISQFANGSNVLHLRPDMIKNMLIPVAKKELINKFVKIIRPIFKEVEFLYLKNDNLIKQRDLLLPRLMSGKLEVK